MKDSIRGQKSTVVISKPLQKQLTQTKAPSLKDAELEAATAINSQLERENVSLRQAVGDLTAKISEMQSNLSGLP